MGLFTLFPSLLSKMKRIVSVCRANNATSSKESMGFVAFWRSHTFPPKTFTGWRFSHKHPINEVKELRTLNSESMALRIRSEPVYDARFPDIVRRHLHPYSISHGQTNKPLSHFPRDMCKNKVLIGKLHPKHCSREDSGNSSFNDDCVLSRHGI